MSSFSYTPISGERGEIRLLIIQPGTGDETVECHLQKAVLSEDPSYEALSYTWGSAKNTHLITLNGFPRDVTDNLGLALRSLRQPEKPRTMWIDALCINQADLDEKSEQLPKMWDIYTSATRLVAWLGPARQAPPAQVKTGESIWAQICDFWRKLFGYLFPSRGHDGEAAIEAIQDVVLKLKDVFYEELNHVSPGLLLGLGVNVNLIDWPCIWDFLNRSYWRRVWVVQELASRRAPWIWHEGDTSIIMCGSKSILKTDLERFMVILFAILAWGYREFQKDDGSLIEPLKSSLTLGHTAALRMWQIYFGNSDLEGLLCLTRMLQATVPHDRLYGMLGLVPDEQKYLIVPDYSKPIKSVYADICKGLILHTKSLDCILYNRISYNGERPSWTSDAGPRFPDGVLWEKGEAKFDAATKIPLSIGPTDIPHCLSVKGIRVGVLDVVIGPCNQEMPPEVQRELKEHLHRIGPDLKLPIALDFDCFMSEVVAFRETLSIDDREVLWRTLTMDHVIATVDDKTTPAPQSFEEEFQILMEIRELPADFEPNLRPKDRLDTYHQRSDFRRAVVVNGGNRCFFRTACGKMGLGPYSSRKGHEVAALFGGERFCVLRPVSAGFEVVGDAYVHGGMHGEFLSAVLDGDDSALEEFILY
ncbi:het-domain-containing protein [Fusarium flagelliforme]|uniref:Het-domain-containing protein n=1 Tax=Fusarium flagelliforme TaxID=2675880 RepID=A0A395MEH7_9HYPO|nr:het-domain-containing protein [Fusarium flagelliforme]